MSAVRWRFVFWLAGMCTTTSILKHQLDHLRIGGGTASIVLSIFLSPTTLGIPIIIISKAQGFAYSCNNNNKQQYNVKHKAKTGDIKQEINNLNKY